MKKVLVSVIGIVAFLLCLSPHACFAYANRAGPDFNESTFILPPSLQYVDEEAFAGTSVKTVVFQDGLLQILNDAFAHSEYLENIYIPSTVTLIADSAIPQGRGIVIHGVEGSYADNWASEHRFAFVGCDIWSSTYSGKAFVNRQLQCLFWIAVFMTVLKLVGVAQNIFKSMRPQDRPELYPINYRFP